MSRIALLYRWAAPMTAAGIALALLVPASCMAATYPKASGVDGRLRYTSYHPDQVYNLQAAIGRALFIQFADGEEMEKFYTGDSDAWEVGKHANMIAIKPTAEIPDTNLIVSTSAGRVYTFDLSLNDRAPMYGIRFSYPEEQHQASETARAKRELSASLDPHAQTRKNFRYAGAGSRAVQPSEVFDNGTHTFMRFPENTIFPSVFAIGPDGGETLVNKTVRGNWLILPAVGREWRLRSGKAVMCVRNDAFAPSGIDNPGETTSRAIERAAR
ncbi:type IV secretory pathway, VirB9 component (plasmid) [Thioflavicoccus mobilis 8321]|uniref:Type IV secretory pathway, VirB9 component n=1 Tax=Thioflavicoccus mobilis 8321 TaxID=765912 RepID=L0H2F7_9GAMM|nr:TrbG/VirB9 family P-type conjugative transfer protein [Thioflavicoccus mobilis]AGA92411.1 type IV secretory pathway, VirB9 component [Thioflavicoccus mobilis 8321]